MNLDTEQNSKTSASGSSWPKTVAKVSLVLLGFFSLLVVITFYSGICLLISMIAFALAAGVHYSDSKAPTSSFLVISFKAILILLCFVFLFWGFLQSRTCISTYCDGVIGVLAIFAVSFISIVLAFLLHLKTYSSSDNLNADEVWSKKLKGFKVGLVVLVLLFSAIIGGLHLKYGNETFTPYFSLDCTDAKIGPHVDLSGADLSNYRLADCDLSNRNLEGANFAGAALTCSDFSNSNLQGAVFTDSNIRGANFDNTNLKNAMFDELDTDFVHQNEYLDNGASLVLSYRTISPQCIGNFDDDVFDDDVLSFTNADLTNASFKGFKTGSFPSISFENAVLNGANFSGADFGRTIFTGAFFSNTKLFGVTILNSELSGADMSNSLISDFYATNLYSCPDSLPDNFTCVVFDEYSSSHNSSLSIIVGPSTRFSGHNAFLSPYRLKEIFSDYSGINLSGLYFPNSEFYHTIMANGNMSYSNLSNSRFSYNESLYDSLLSQYNRWCEGEDASNSSFYYEGCIAERDSEMLDPMGIDKIEDLQYELAADLSGVDFTGAILSNSDFSYSDLTDATLSQAELTGVTWYYTICPDGNNTGESGNCSAS